MCRKDVENAIYICGAISFTANQFQRVFLGKQSYLGHALGQRGR